MDERPVVQQLPRADERRAEHLGPISRELVLVDPVLAKQARKLLPEPDGRYAHRERVVREELRSVRVPPGGETQAALAADGRVRSGHVRRRGGPGRPPSTRASGAVRRPRGSHGLASTDRPRREPGETACDQARAGQPGAGRCGAASPETTLGRERPRSRGEGRGSQRQHRLAAAGRFQPRGGAAGPWRSATGHGRLPGPRHRFPRRLLAPVHGVPLHDRQLRPQRAPVDWSSHLGRDRRLYIGLYDGHDLLKCRLTLGAEGLAPLSVTTYWRGRRRDGPASPLLRLGEIGLNGQPRAAGKPQAVVAGEESF